MIVEKDGLPICKSVNNEQNFSPNDILKALALAYIIKPNKCDTCPYGYLKKKQPMSQCRNCDTAIRDAGELIQYLLKKVGIEYERQF